MELFDITDQLGYTDDAADALFDCTSTYLNDSCDGDSIETSIEGFVDSYLNDCTTVSEEEYETCCGDKMLLDEYKTEMVCQSCGISKPYFVKIDSLTELSFTTVSVSGSCTYMHKGMIYHSSNGNYTNFKRRIIYDKLIKNRYNSKSIQFDEKILARARDICLEVLDGHTNRHDILLELLTACLRMANNESKLYYKDAVFAKYMGLKTSAFPNGDKILREWAIRKEIPVNIDITQLKHIISCYFKQTQFDKKYMPFVYELVIACSKLHIAEKSMLMTKCVGSMYILATSKKFGMSIDEFELKTGIKRSTFQRFAMEIYAHKSYFENIFAKYGI